ncbi:type II secretion system F family protein [bacterium]|nr:type II secretion system F family protein [bacterium]
MSLQVIFILVFITIFLLILTFLLIIRRMQNPTARRMKNLEKTNITDKNDSRLKELQRKKDAVHASVEKMLADISRFVKQDKEKQTRMQAALIQAGYHRENCIKIFLGIKLLTAVGCFLLYLFMGLQGDRPFNVVLLMSIIMGAVGFILPNVVLRFKTQKRRAVIAQALPDALDLLVITVEAGLGLNAALMRVGTDLVMRCPPLAQEFNRVNQDLRTGKPRDKALRSLSDRNQIEDLRILVGALILADRLGTSIADTLRAQADSLRTRIRQKAEEQAAKAGIKLLFPLVFFVLPALIIILMGPGLIALYRTFQ